MAKTISILVSITLLVGADRFINWHRAQQDKKTAESIRAQMQQDASQHAPRLRVIPTNIPSQPSPEVIQL